MSAEKKLYVAATSQNDGKTTFSLGLVVAFQRLARSIGFIKPVGQRYVTVDGQNVDEDSVLVQRVCGLKSPLKDMSPVAISRGFTREFLDHPAEKLPELERSILHSYSVAAEHKQLVVVEGTGHAGVGSTFGLSNARVAQLIGAKVIIVTGGGIGRPLDEVALNLALFREKGVPVIGIIANKVLPEKLPEVSRYLRIGLERQGLKLLGAAPYVPRLTWPSVRQIMEELHLEVLTGKENLDTPVESVVVGAMSLHNALRHIGKGTLLITPGDREELILATIMSSMLSPRTAVAGVVLTGKLQPHGPTLRILKQTPIPILLSGDHTYSVASNIHVMTVKIRENDDEKIQLAASLVERYVDFQTIWQEL